MKSKTSTAHRRATLDQGRVAADVRNATAPMLEALEDPSCMESRTFTNMAGEEEREFSPLLKASRKMQEEMLKAFSSALHREEKRT